MYSSLPLIQFKYPTSVLTVCGLSIVKGISRWKVSELSALSRRWTTYVSNCMTSMLQGYKYVLRGDYCHGIPIEETMSKMCLPGKSCSKYALGCAKCNWQCEWKCYASFYGLPPATDLFPLLDTMGNSMSRENKWDRSGDYLSPSEGPFIAHFAVDDAD